MERTKSAIVEAFQEILEETPISKITVKSIVERCGINRNTFYYYFDGIPGLMEYLMTSMADQLLDSFDVPIPNEELGRIVSYFTQRKKSVLHVYRYFSKDQFFPFLNKLAVYVVDRGIRQATNEAPIPEEDMTVLIRFYKSALVGMLLDWLESGMGYDMSSTVDRLCELMAGSTRRAIEKCQAKQ